VAFIGYKSGVWFTGWYVRRLDAPIERVVPRLDVRVTTLTPDDVEQYLQFHSNLSREAYLNRMRQMQVCFAVRDPAGALASVTWTAVEKVWIDFVEREVALQEGEVYLYDSYTAPAFRGKRLQPYLCEYILSHSRDIGYRQAIVIVAPENRSNIASRKRSGFVRTGWIFSVRTRWLRRDFFQGIRSDPGDS